MTNYEQLGLFYLGKVCDPASGKLEDEPLLYESKHLTTHAVCVGMTGSGKTGLGVTILEEAAIDGIPAIIIDPKGDLSNLLLTFPALTGQEFEPWVDEGEAQRQGLSKAAFAEQMAKKWKDGLANWDEPPERIRKMADAVEHVIYTPASQAGIPLAILNSFAAPPAELIQDTGAFRDRILSTVSSLLGLLNIKADPLQSREHILISTILDKAWREHRDIDLPTLIQQVQTPPFDKVGVLDLETFYSTKDRLALAMQLNHLLASPGFQAWMEGEPLDIQRLLYNPAGKPKHSILYIAHLSDSERMFFVTLLLNEVIAWMRRQSGTSSLRALLVMDEIFGFFPPTASPSSKWPMILLLKQARAYGLGIVLATQNPVDLDYKGLANCGTWFIGKLQTDRDRSKVLEGLKQAASGNLGDARIEKMLAQCGSRKFILHTVYQPEPLLFQTRWTLAYLGGPLTLAQVQKLMNNQRSGEPTAAKQPAKAVAASVDGTSAAANKPLVSGDVAEYFLEIPGVHKALTYHPYLMGTAKLHFVDSKNNVDTWKQKILLKHLVDGGKDILWDGAEDITKETLHWSKQAPTNAAFTNLPPGIVTSKQITALGKALGAYLYQTQTFKLYRHPELKIVSRADESESDFRTRTALMLREQRDAKVSKLKAQYEGKIATIVDKVRQAQRKVEEQRTEVGRQKMDTMVSIGTTLLGALFGRKKLSKTTITQAEGSMRRAGGIGKKEERATSAEETLKSYQQQLQNLQDDMHQELMALSAPVDPAQLQLDEIVIRPRKTDLVIESIALAWTPFLHDQLG